MNDSRNMMKMKLELEIDTDRETNREWRWRILPEKGRAGEKKEKTRRNGCVI